MDFPLNQSIENLDRKASKQSSFNSPGGEWRSFREALGEEDLVKEIKELKDAAPRKPADE